SRLELHGIDTHHATSLASGDSSIHPARRRSCDRRLMVRANQVKRSLIVLTNASCNYWPEKVGHEICLS
ncbi:hypothetical protein, partial [Xanthomonas hortorum]